MLILLISIVGILLVGYADFIHYYCNSGKVSIYATHALHAIDFCLIKELFLKSPIVSFEGH